MSTVVALSSLKGGCGKSTLSVHIAAWLSKRHPTLLVDSDVQASSSSWIREIDPQFPCERLLSPDDVVEQITKLRQSYEYIICDSPGGMSETPRAILLVSDRALLPCGPSALDLRSLGETLRLVKQAQMIRSGLPKAVIIPNRLQRHYRLSKELMDTFSGLGVPYVSGLGLRQAFSDAAGQGKLAWDMENPIATDELETLMQELFTDEQDRV